MLLLAPAGPVRLEAGTQVTIVVRLVEKRIERLRALTDDCPVDAGGLDLHWLKASRVPECLLMP